MMMMMICLMVTKMVTTRKAMVPSPPRGPRCLLPSPGEVMMTRRRKTWKIRPPGISTMASSISTRWRPLPTRRRITFPRIWMPPWRRNGGSRRTRQRRPSYRIRGSDRARNPTTAKMKTMMIGRNLLSRSARSIAKTTRLMPCTTCIRRHMTMGKVMTRRRMLRI